MIDSPAFCRSRGTVVWSLRGDAAVDTGSFCLVQLSALPSRSTPFDRWPRRCLAFPNHQLDVSSDVVQLAAEAVVTATGTEADWPLRRHWCLTADVDRASTDAGVPGGQPADWQASTVVVEARADALDERRPFVVWTAKRSICRRWLSCVCCRWPRRRVRDLAVLDQLSSS